MIASPKIGLANIVICTIVALAFIQQLSLARPTQEAAATATAIDTTTATPAGTTNHHHPDDDDKIDDEGSDLAADNPIEDDVSLSAPRALSDYFTSLLQGGVENGNGADDNRPPVTRLEGDNFGGPLEPETPRVIKGMGFGKGFMG